MAEITSNMIRDIREKTGAGMMDCKKALVENNGNFDEAVDWLRKKGLAAAAKKASRVAAEGLVCVSSNNDKSATVVEINSETDFVAKNDKFQSFASNVGKISAVNSCETLDQLLDQKMGSETVKEGLTNLIATIGENMNIRRFSKVCVNEGIVATYVHNVVVDGLGKIGVLVALESSADKSKLSEFGKKLAMHIAAANPQYLTISEVPSSVVEHEKGILLEQIQGQNKPKDVMDKMVEGRIRKFFEETVLLEQVYIMDGKKKVSEILEDLSKEFGSKVSIKQFVKFVLGEGIEKNESNFADEVKSLQ